MDVGVPGDQGDDGIVHPVRGLLRECVEGNEKRESPELQNNRRGCPTVYDLTDWLRPQQTTKVRSGPSFDGPK